jgi:NAD(P)-dependent dehydrogenase (short-subunit alcohol dehydrogenase family)
MLRVYAVNLVAATWLMGWLVTRGLARTTVRIVNVSSGAGVSPFAGLAVYGGTKAALRMTGMVLAAELAGAAQPPRDLTILSYGPGPIDTPMQALARTTPVDVFPLQQTFARWATEGRLQAPAVPAAEIVTYLEADGYPAFHECFGEIRRPDAPS